MPNNLKTAFPMPVGDGGLPLPGEIANDPDRRRGDSAKPSSANEMSDGERLTRAREAWIAAKKPWRWLARRIRAGKHDHWLRTIVIALEDARRPMSLIIADRDEATVALILRTTPGLTRDEATVAALLTAVRMGRRG